MNAYQNVHDSMRITSFLKILYQLGVFGFIVLTWTHAGFSAAITMEYSLGFNDRFQINKWTPITVTLENRGKAVFGKLEVLVTSGSEYYGNVYQSTYSLDLDLPYGSRKQCSFTVLIESITHDLVIRLQRNQKTIVSRSINLRAFYTPNKMAGILIDDIYPEVLPALPEFLSPIHFSERYLPETWYGYDGVRLLAMEAGKVNRLKDPQLRALEKWIRQGGFLIITGSINAGVLMDRGIQQLLPITVKGLKKFNRLKALVGFSGQEIVHSDLFLVLHTWIPGSKVLAQEGDIPLVMDRKLGNGKIVFLPFDPHSPPFTRLMSKPAFWEKILMASPNSDSKPLQLPIQRILQVMLAAANIKFPVYWIIAFSIALYFVLILMCVRKIKRYKWGGIRLLFLTIVCFSLAGTGYYVLFSQKNASYNSFCSIRLTGESTYSDSKYILGIYSTGKEPYDFFFEESPLPIKHVLRNNTTRKLPSPYYIKQTGRYHHIVGVSGKWSYDFYTASSRFEFPLLADIRLDDGNLKVMIENRTPYEIVDCMVFYNRRYLKIKDIGADRKESISIAGSQIDLQTVYKPGDSKSMNIRGASIESRFFDTMKNNLEEDFRSAIHKTIGDDTGEKTIIITGWIKADIMKPSFAQQDVTGQGVTWVSWKGKI